MQHDRPDSPAMEQVEKPRTSSLLAGVASYRPAIPKNSRRSWTGAIQKVRRHDSGPGEKDLFAERRNSPRRALWNQSFAGTSTAGFFERFCATA